MAEQSWWYRGRDAAIKVALRHVAEPRGKILDYGAGFGPMFSLLSSYGPVSAFEVYEPCVARLRTRGYQEVYDSQAALAAAGPFSIIGAFDVIEHIENDHEFLMEARRILSPDGIVVATVPAHQFLWSDFDVINRHFRRYSKANLRTLFESAGYEIVFLSYWNKFLFPVAALLRLIGRGGGGNLTPHPLVNRVLTGLLLFEARLLRFIPFPGLSLAVVARPRA